MAKFAPTRRGNSCFICGDASGDCRILDQAVLCHSFIDQDAGVTGWRYLHPNKTGVWGVYVRDDGRTGGKSWQDIIEERNRKRQQERERQARKLLSVAERNKHYRTIASQLNLSQKHRGELLRRRGLTEDEIKFAYDQGWIRTWQPGLEVSSVSPNLAGINPKGIKRTLLSVPGISISALDVNGNIVGHQIGSDDREKFGKYIWLSSASRDGSSPHLPNGELPLFIWRHPEAKAVSEVRTCEGALKSLILALKTWFREGRKDVVFIGAAGGNFASSPETFLTGLELSEAKKATLYPDAGMLGNSNIMRQYKKALEVGEKSGIDFEIAWWNQNSKLDPDCDELPEGIEIDYITPRKFWEMAEQHRKLLAWRKSKGFTATRTVNERYFDTAVPPENILLAILSGLGTGKTHWLAKVIKELEREGWVAIGYRNSLLIQSCERWGFYHYQSMEQQERILKKDPYFKVAFCVDSLVHFDPEFFDGKNLILDEVMGIINALQQGGTAISLYRDKCLELFKEALRRAKRVIIADGHLADWAVDYIRKLIGREIEVIKVKNEYKGQGFDIELVLGALKEGELRTRDRSPIIHAICNAADPIVIGTDSQCEAEALDKILTAEGRKVTRLDGKTSSEDWVAEFLSNPDEYIRKYEPDVLIYTPCAESGLDISIRNYFTDQYLLLFGVLTVDPILQMLGRIRDPECYRHIICPEYGLKDEEITRTPFPEVFERLLAEFVVLDGIAALEGVDNQEALQKLISELVLRSQGENYKALSIIKTKENYERDHLRQCLRECLINSGHRLEETTLEACSLEFLTRTKEEIKQQNSVDRFVSKDISVEEARKLDRKFNVSWEDRCAIFKAKLRHRLPGLDQNETLWNAELFYKISYDDPQFISKQELFWLLQHPEVAKLQQQEKWIDWLGKDTISLQDVRSRHLKVKALKAIGIEQFLQPGFTWTADSPEVQAAVKAARDNSVKLALGAIGKQSPVEWIGRQLQKIGLETKSVQSTENNLRKRIYSIEPKSLTDCYRWEILQAIERRWECYLNGQKTTPDFSVFLQPETVTPSNVEGCTPSPKNIYIYTQRCAEDNQPDQAIDPVVNLNSVAVEVDNPSLAKDDIEEPAKAIASDAAVTPLEAAGKVAPEDAAPNPIEQGWQSTQFTQKPATINKDEFKVGGIARWLGSNSNEKLWITSLDWKTGYAMVKSLLSLQKYHTSIDRLEVMPA